MFNLDLSAFEMPFETFLMCILKPSERRRSRERKEEVENDMHKYMPT